MVLPTFWGTSGEREIDARETEENLCIFFHISQFSLAVKTSEIYEDVYEKYKPFVHWWFEPFTFFRLMKANYLTKKVLLFYALNVIRYLNRSRQYFLPNIWPQSVWSQKFLASANIKKVFFKLILQICREAFLILLMPICRKLYLIERCPQELSFWLAFRLHHGSKKLSPFSNLLCLVIALKTFSNHFSFVWISVILRRGPRDFKKFLSVWSRATTTTTTTTTARSRLSCTSPIQRSTPSVAPPDVNQSANKEN